MSAIQYLKETSTFSMHLGVGSFVVGMLLLFGFVGFSGQSTTLLAIGIFYVIFAFFVNTIMFFALLCLFIIQPKRREYLFIKMLLILANVPIVMLYIKIISDKIYFF